MANINTIALYGTMIEVGLIAIIIIMIFVLKLTTHYKNKSTLDERAELEVFLKKHMKNHRQIYPSNYTNGCKKIDILLSVIHDFDQFHQDDDWLLIRSNFIRNIVLPLARQAVTKKDWRMRQYAAQVFTLYSENSDADYILKLIYDDIPLVRYSAAAAGIRYGSEKVFDLVIQRMSEETWQTQTIYLQSFENIPAATHYFINRIMKISTDTSARATCYNLLLQYPIFIPDWDMTNDIKSSDIKLALSAVRYLAYSEREASIKTLMDLLTHSDWRMRTVATTCLGDLRVPSTMMKMSRGLDDENWWVRFATRQALLKFGNHGLKLLTERHVQEDKVNINISQQVLNTI